jgi:hypothetical protein
MQNIIQPIAGSTADIDVIIQNAADWSYHAPTHTFEATMPDGAASIQVTTGELSGKDARLPLILQQIVKDAARWKRTSTAIQKSAIAVRKTLEMWGDPKPLTITLRAGQRYVSVIHTMASSHDYLVRVDAATWNLEKHGRGILYATGVGGLTELFLPRDELEEHFPGFEIRFAQVAALGLTTVEMADHVFRPLIVPVTEVLPELDLQFPGNAP